MSTVNYLKKTVRDVCSTQRFFLPIAALVLLGDIALTALIIKKVPYTEIDFATYIQQADVLLRGERDYHKITGDSGPCVYPAGHLYIYSIFHFLGSGKANIPLSQALFGILYILNLAIVILLYHAVGAPSILLPFLACSKRLHSIYVLRLFNDPFAMFFFYVAALALCKRSWTSAVIMFSLALSIKMNILLFLPALATILFRALGLPRSIPLALLFFAVQLLISLPFTSPSSTTRAHYLTQAFDLSRVFLFKWTVNWRWTGLGRMGVKWIRFNWSGPMGAVAPTATPNKSLADRVKLERDFAPTADYILSSLFTANLIGIICSRSLHYQFYSWYAHQIPFLLWRAKLPLVLKALLPITIELAWNTFPSTTLSSFTLLASHLVLLAGLWGAHAGDALQDEAILRARAKFGPAAGGASKGRNGGRGSVKKAVHKR
ncbi:hypothetical protein CF319_g2631 [Tilletia indica]|nr:hypothetical protein CF319_g2631 [Tilletia indica]